MSIPAARRTLGVVFFPAFDWAISPTHPEREERLLYTQDQLLEEGLFDLPGITEERPELASYADIESVHFCPPGVEKVCSVSHLASAGGCIRAADLILEGKKDRAFALVRPPGHHAMRVSWGNRGFCNINNEAVMIAAMRRKRGALRIAVVDTDCHHGDGSQDIFWNDPDTLFISIHQDGRTLYPGTGSVRENGGIGALGSTVNIPLPPGTGDAGYLYAVEQVVLPILHDFQPDFIINSAGQDNHYTDPLTDMRLSAHGYAVINSLIDPHLSVLEGGYSIRGALPYVNLGICLAMAGLSFEYIHEPDYSAAASGGNIVSDSVKRICGEALERYLHPASEPFDGHRSGSWWVRNREVYYDTDGIFEHRRESTRLCSNCPGITVIETSVQSGQRAVCLLEPRNVCETCRAYAREHGGVVLREA